MTLRQYIDAFVADGTFRSVSERFLLATELVYALTDEINEKTVVGTQAVFLNPDNIELTEVQDDESEVKAYAVGFSLAEADKQKLFANYGYADPALFVTKPLLGKPRAATEREAALTSAKSTAYAAKTLATLLFEIYFGLHPFKGRSYFTSLDISPNHDKEFFSEPHKFLLDLSEGNDNRIVNGLQSLALTLWRNSTPQQQLLWLDVFSAQAKMSLADFLARWKQAYHYVYSHSTAPCGDKLPTLVFDDGNVALILSDYRVGLNELYCYRSTYKRYGFCRQSCHLTDAERTVRFLTKEVSLAVATEDNDTERKEVLFEGKQVSLSDFGKDSNRVVFEVVSAKKANILGLKYLLDAPIVAEVKQVQKIFNKDGVVPLIAGARINLLSDCVLIVPDDEPQQPEPQQPKDDVPQTNESLQPQSDDIAPQVDNATDDDTHASDEQTPPSDTEQPRTEQQPTEMQRPVAATDVEQRQTPTALQDNVRMPEPAAVDVTEQANNPLPTPTQQTTATFADVARQTVKLDPIELLRLFTDLCDKLTEANKGGFHFTFVGEQSVVFDLTTHTARLANLSPVGTTNGQKRFASSFTAPETQSLGLGISQNTDNFVLAAVIFECITHLHPYAGAKQFANYDHADPVFVFHSVKVSPNNYDLGEAKQLWVTVPDEVKDMFQAAFEVNSARPTPKQWKQALTAWASALVNE